MNAPARLSAALAALLGDARLLASNLPDCDIRLWLIDPANMQRPFDAEQTRRILEEPPYWCFCWASGLALARWIAAHPERVRGKRVLDFGAGSGIVALAAARAGAREAIACDIDPLALEACRANAALNGVALDYLADLDLARGEYDLLVAADVLYDRANLGLLERFTGLASEVLVADSRVRDFSHRQYRRLGEHSACTWPDLAEPDEFSRVGLYLGRR